MCACMVDCSITICAFACPPEPPLCARQGVLGTGVITPGGVWYVVANVRNAGSSISWVLPGHARKPMYGVASNLCGWFHHGVRKFYFVCALKMIHVEPVSE